MDKIRIKDLEVFANHGVFPEETRLGQKFLVSAVLFTDTREAGMKDDLTKSIHYGEICQLITKFMREHTYLLIEAAAERLAMALLLETPNLERVQLEIKKPWAPIGLPLDTVSVEIERGWHMAYLALGSSMGDKREYLQQAVCAVDGIEGCHVVKVSEFITTEPYGGVAQNEFLNGAMSVRTLLTPEELLEKIHEIEADAGRERILHWGDRTLDIDILLYDDLVLDTEKLQIPHPQMHMRDFVMEPMVQIAPHKRHPIFGKTMLQLNEEKEKVHQKNKENS